MSIPLHQAIRETVIATLNEARGFIVAQVGPEDHKIAAAGSIVRQIDESASLLQTFDALPPAAIHTSTFLGRLNKETARRFSEDDRILGWCWTVHLAEPGQAHKPDVFLLAVEVRGSRQPLMSSFYSKAVRRIEHNLSAVVAYPTLEAITRRLDERFRDVEQETDDGEG